MERTAVIATASTYIMSGLVGHDPDGVTMAPGCYRGENGWETGKDAATIANNLRNSHSMATMRGVRNMRWVVQDEEAVCLFEYHMTTAILNVIEYFKVGEGLIQEIRPTTGGLERAIAYGTPTPAKPMTRATGQPAAAERLCAPFLSGLQAHDLTGVAFAGDVSLLENSRPILYGPEALRTWATGGIVAETKRVSVQRWVVEGNDVVGIFELDRADGRVYWGSAYFRLYNNQIRDIQLAYGLAPARA